MKLTFNVQGHLKVSKILGETLPAETRKQLARAVLAEAKIIKADAQSLAPTATGKLRQDIKIRRKAKGLSAYVGVFSAERGYIARFLTFGVKPHEIRANNNSYLQLPGGALVKSVNHPGFKPRDFLLGASQRRREHFQAAIRQTMIEVLRSVER